MEIHTCGHLRSVRRAFLLAAFFGVTALAQKSFVEGGLALELFCARLVDEQHTGDATQARIGNDDLHRLTVLLEKADVPGLRATRG